MPLIKPTTSLVNGNISNITEKARILAGTGQGTFSVEDASAVYSSENYGNLSHSVATNVEQRMEAIKSSLSQAGTIAAAKDPMTMKRLKASMEGFIAGSNINHFKGQDYDLRDLAPRAGPGENVQVFVDGQASGDKARGYSAESFDDVTARSVAAWSAGYNFAMPGQDPVVEMFYPSIILAADQMGICVQVQLHQFWSGIIRNPSGVAETFRRRNIMDTLIDPTLLNNNQSKCFPILAADKDATLTAPVTDVPARSVQIGTVDKYETVQTTALAVNKRINLISLGATPGLLANGVMTQKDTLDKNVVLTEVFISFTDPAQNKTELLKFNVKRLSTAHATFAQQGSTQDMTLTFDTNALSLSKTALQADGETPTTIFAGLAGNIRFSLRVPGTINLERGDIEVNPGTPILIEALDADGKAIVDSVALKAAADTIATGKVKYFNVDVNRSLSNRRQIGNLVDSTSYYYVYGVPLHPPVASVRPVSNESIDRQNEDLSSLVELTHVQMTAHGLKELFDNFNYLKAAQKGGMVQDLYNPQVGGLARYYSKTVIVDSSLAVKDITSNLTSSARMDDVRAAVVNALRVPVAQAVQDSRLKIAAQSNGRSGNIKVKIATDPKTANLLQLVGDTNMFGEGYETEIVTTMIKDFNNILMIGLCPVEGSQGDEYDILGTGHTLIRPEVVWAMDRQIDGDVSRYMAVQPSFRHISNGNVWLRFNLTDVNAAIAEKMPYQIKNA